MNTTEIVNLTPHPLNLKRVDGTTHTIAPSGTVARVAEKREALGALMGLPITRASYGAVEGLPAPTPGRVYVVSALVLAAVQDRADVFAPGPAIRDGEGKIIGADGLSATAAYVPPTTPTPPRTPNDDDPAYDPTGETTPAGGSEYFTAPYPAKKLAPLPVGVPQKRLAIFEEPKTMYLPEFPSWDAGSIRFPKYARGLMVKVFSNREAALKPIDSLRVSTSNPQVFSQIGDDDLFVSFYWGRDEETVYAEFRCTSQVATKLGAKPLEKSRLVNAHSSRPWRYWRDEGEW